MKEALDAAKALHYTDLVAWVLEYEVLERTYTDTALSSIVQPISLGYWKTATLPGAYLLTVTAMMST